MTEKTIIEKLEAHHGKWRRISKPIGLPRHSDERADEDDMVVLTTIPEQALVEIKRLRQVIERDRGDVAGALTIIKTIIAGRAHLRGPGRGSFEWDDESYQAEFGAALDELESAIRPLSRISHDWSDSPTAPEEINKARATKVPLLEQAADALKVFNGHDSVENLKYRYGDGWWVKIGLIEQNLRIASKELARTGGLDVPTEAPT